MANAKGGRNMIERHNGGISLAAFQATDILLSDAGHLRETLLGESLLPSQSRKIPTNQLAHIHARKLRHYTL